MAIETTVQTVFITDVGEVIITDIVEDDEEGTYVREIRVLGEADESGTKNPVFTLRLSAASRTAVELSAPVQTF